MFKIISGFNSSVESISEAYSDIAPDASSKFYSILLSTQPAVAAAVAEIIETAIKTATRRSIMPFLQRSPILEKRRENHSTIFNQLR